MARANRTSATLCQPNPPRICSSAGIPFQALADRYLPTKICRNGSYIFTCGSVLDSLYIVKEGRVLMTRSSPCGSRETILGFVEPGECLGDVSLFRGGTATFNAQAIQRTILHVVRQSDFRYLLGDASSCQSLIGVLVRRLDDAWTQMEAMSGGRLEERICATLSWLCERIGVETREGFEIDMNQSQLAQLVGSSRESLNRQIQILKKHGILRIGGFRRTSLFIRDLHKLKLWISEEDSDIT